MQSRILLHCCHFIIHIRLDPLKLPRDPLTVIQQGVPGTFVKYWWNPGCVVLIIFRDTKLNWSPVWEWAAGFIDFQPHWTDLWGCTAAPEIKVLTPESSELLLLAVPVCLLAIQCLMFTSHYLHQPHLCFWLISFFRENWSQVSYSWPDTASL